MYLSLIIADSAAVRRFSTNPPQQHRTVAMNNACRHLKIRPGRYMGRFLLKRRGNTRAGEKGKKTKNRKRRKVFRINATGERLIIGNVDQNVFPFASWGKLFFSFIIWFVTICLKYIVSPPHHWWC